MLSSKPTGILMLLAEQWLVVLIGRLSLSTARDKFWTKFYTWRSEKSTDWTLKILQSLIVSISVICDRQSCRDLASC